MGFVPQKQGFLGIPEKEGCRPEDAKVVVIPFGLEATVSYGAGTARGPGAIIEASHQVELFDEELWREAVFDYGVATLAPFAVEKPVGKALDQLEGVVEGVLAKSKFPLVLGGEHALSPGALRPFMKRHKKLSILHFDAHADLRDGYEGEHFSHASAIRRVLDLGGISVVSIGIRNISAGEIPYLEKNSDRIKIYWGKDRQSYDPGEIVAALGDAPVYVSFDLDGFDSSLMPATGTPEPGGLFWDDVMPILREAGRTKTIVGADVVELAPMDQNHAPDFLAAKLCYKILNYSLCDQS